jgi:hypothetical protein
MAKSQTSGTCLLCEQVFAKKAMSRHLTACRQEHPAEEHFKSKQLVDMQTFHLLVEGAYLADYWLHLEAAGDTTLEALDNLLRTTWLECCGHMSAFQIGGRGYSCSPMAEFDERDMNVPLRKVLQPSLTFSYEYDFGSTTPLKLCVIGDRQTKFPRKTIQIQARNLPPDLRCAECEKPATVICTECGGELLCEDCGAEHECGEEFALPVVNSPRTGVCAYSG